MSQHIARRRRRSIELRSDNRTQVADADLHGASRGALGLPRDIHGRPSQTEGGGGIDASSGEEGAGIRDAGAVRDVRRIAYEDGVADDGNEGARNHERRAMMQALRDDRHRNRQQRRQRVRRHGE